MAQCTIFNIFFYTEIYCEMDYKRQGSIQVLFSHLNSSDSQ